MTKIRVDIIGENGITSTKKHKIKGNKVILRKGRRGKGGIGWKPSFTKDSLLPYKTGLWPFKFLRQKLMVKQDASECVNFYGKEGVEVPEWSREELAKASTATVIKNAGVSTQKLLVPTFVYLLLGAILMFQLVMFFFFNQRFKFV